MKVVVCVILNGDVSFSLSFGVGEYVLSWLIVLDDF